MFERWQEANPEPTTELKYGSPYQLLVAVILSAQATDVGVNKVTPALFAAAPTAKAMLQLGLARITDKIRTIGLFNSKATNILEASHILVEEHGGLVPCDRQALEELPGVGRKTANVVLNTIFGQPVIAVDTHIFRVANRTRIAAGKTPLEVEQRLLRLVPKRFHRGAHHWLILHGRYVCIARKPRCNQCIVSDLCEYPDKIRE